MKSGLKKIARDHRDYDFVKSHKHLFGSMGTLPSSYFVEANLWCPNQEISQAISGLPNIPAMPFGCTDYGQTDLCIDEDGQLYNPMDLEDITHANANGGTDIRTSLEATKKAFGRVAYFNIKPSGLLDSFDAVRLAMYSAQPEKRAVSVGTIWYLEWQNVGPGGIVQMPNVLKLDGPWHNWVICGWESFNGVLYLKGKSWQGPSYAAKGFHYVSREVFNSIMSVYGTAAFTLTKTKSGAIETVDMNIVATIVSFIRNLFGL